MDLILKQTINSHEAFKYRFFAINYNITILQIPNPNTIMVGFFPEMVPVQVDRLPCKRKPGEMLKEGKRNEEKKLRVEKVVTALCNTDTKNTPMSKNGERRV